ncbi:fucolectin-like [Branchiostoma lanceolatum]|uniref:fucolectin-like n=1 Tax=Branchiostoma lanceolatum TaxID=7740 RepID=UPI003451A80E
MATASANIALGKTAYQSSSWVSGGAASWAVDGNTDADYDSGSCTHTRTEANPTWWIDLGRSYVIDRVVIFYRQDSCCWERINPFNIHIGDCDQVSRNPKCGGDHRIDVNEPPVSVPCQGMTGRYVAFSGCMVEVNGEQKAPPNGQSCYVKADVHEGIRR